MQAGKVIAAPSWWATGRKVHVTVCRPAGTQTARIAVYAVSGTAACPSTETSHAAEPGVTQQREPRIEERANVLSADGAAPQRKQRRSDEHRDEDGEDHRVPDGDGFPCCHLATNALITFRLGEVVVLHQLSLPVPQPLAKCGGVRQPPRGPAAPAYNAPCLCRDRTAPPIATPGSSSGCRRSLQRGSRSWRGRARSSRSTNRSWLLRSRVPRACPRLSLTTISRSLTSCFSAGRACSAPPSSHFGRCRSRRLPRQRW